MHCTFIRIISILVFMFVAAVTNGATEVPSQAVLDWTLRIGGQRFDEAHGITADSNGFVYVAGHLDDGQADGFLRKIDSNGGFQWQYLFGANGSDSVSDVSVDLADNPLVGGFTAGSIGGINAGGTDSLVLKVDSLGNQLWSNQFGTSGNDTVHGVVPDPFGNVYVSGTNNLLDPRLYLRKFDTDGNLLWTRGAGTSQRSTGLSVASDAAGNAYVTGWVSPTAGNPDIILLKYNPEGDLEWTRRLITSGADVGLEVAVDGIGGIYVTGYTTGNLFAPNASNFNDVFLMKYDTAGNRIWQTQFGNTSNDTGRGLAFGENGDVYLAGSTDVGGGTIPNFDNADIFLRKYDGNGSLQWASQFGTGGFAEVLDMILVGRRDLYIAGRSWEESDPDGSRMDAVIYKISLIPEPTSIVLMAGMVATLAYFRRSVPLRIYGL